jgi:RNA polymerase sigma-70 factor (ECF subfamily)
MLWKRSKLRKSTALPSLYEETEAARYGIAPAEFEQILQQVLRRREEQSGSSNSVLLERLHLRELVLARACARGNEIAWNDFMASYRPTIVSAARQLCRNFAEAEEVAGSLYAELYGLKEREGKRVSLLESYQGTGSLAGWLRMVLAQREVDHWRQRRRLVAWEDEQIEPADPAALETVADGLQPLSVLQESVATALHDLPHESRLLLSLYYLDERSLAEIGEFFHVHESTVSRRLNRVLQETRERVLAGLRQRGLDASAAEDALRTDVRRLTLDVTTFLASSTGRPPKRAHAQTKASLPARLWRAAGASPRQTLGDPT